LKLEIALILILPNNVDLGLFLKQLFISGFIILGFDPKFNCSDIGTVFAIAIFLQA